NEEQPPDPNKYWIQVMKFEELNEVQAPTETKKKEGEPAKTETREADQHLSKAEEAILSYILANGYTSREEISRKCSEKGMEVAVRSVSRYLKILTDKGLLQRKAKIYEPTDLSRKISRQDTL
ncbi:MAG: BlaI/MecI/CopY family transcriptional regulator, partial [Nitrososphaerota archaeon]|nr:BlaI/MecI/CopY family transcriptional regulator [Nitrososphaerota archaeon]